MDDLIYTKYCPDLVGHKQVQGNMRGTGMINHIVLNRCLKEKCVAFKDGVCMKYDNTTILINYEEDEQ